MITKWRNMTFDELHNRGCAKFDLDWVRANEKAVAVAQELGFDYTSKSGRLLLSALVYRLLLDDIDDEAQ